mgnify:CR=1 FL=1
MSLSGEIRSWNWECFHCMKKNEIKTGRNKPPEVRTREQIEDRAFNRMLLWLATAAVVEVVMVLINRFYVHTRVSELGIKMPLYKVLTVFPIAGAVLFVLFAHYSMPVRSKSARAFSASAHTPRRHASSNGLSRSAFLRRSVNVRLPPCTV